MMRADHAYFRYPLYFYCLFALGQFATGAALYFIKIGVHPPAVVEYYRGSLEMLETYPVEADRLMEPKTADGLLKVTLPHFLFYFFNAFFFIHLIRSLLRQARPPGWLFAPRAIDVLTIIHFTGAAMDIAAGYLVLYGPTWTAYIRIVAFFWFTLSGVLLVGMLIYLMARRAPQESAATRPAGV
jgi:hypothetical protein